MVSRQVETISWENLKEYHYDNIKIEIPIFNIEELQENFFVNGLKLKEFISFKSKHIEVSPNKLLINLKNTFGEIPLSSKQIDKKAKIVPSKIFQDLNPKEAYLFVKNKVFSDIRKFLSFIVKDFEDLKMLEYFKIITEDFIRSSEYLVIFLEKATSSCKSLLQNLFGSGPVHKEILIQKSISGTKVLLSPKNIIEPYKFYYKQTHTLDTILNQMIFQTLYFVIQECNYLKYIARVVSEERTKKELLNRINETMRIAYFLLDKYQLWFFFTDKPLNLSELSSKISTQPNFYYKKVFEIYKEIVKIVFSRTILVNVEEGIEFPILSFERIYELWAISLFYNSLSKKYKFSSISLESYKKRKVKMRMEFFNKPSKKSLLIYEIKFSPVTDSLYFEKLVSDKEYFNIKPDLLIILERRKKKKIFLGDIKFSKDERMELPKLKDMYKILGYLIDLSKKSEILKNEEVEGILVFPGFIEPIRVPQIRKMDKHKKLIYINILPLNFKNNQLTLI
ncbi:MAG: hypothetical protein QXI58_07580 [Candidatus Micrarchaeia archaeon]